jgi:hypothetical protein
MFWIVLKILFMLAILALWILIFCDCIAKTPIDVADDAKIKAKKEAQAWIARNRDEAEKARKAK